MVYIYTTNMDICNAINPINLIKYVSQLAFHDTTKGIIIHIDQEKIDNMPHITRSLNIIMNIPAKPRICKYSNSTNYCIKVTHLHQDSVQLQNDLYAPFRL